MKPRGLAARAILLTLVAEVCLAQDSPVFRPPPTVSPGDAERSVLVEDRCPTFSWGAVGGATAYEVAVYALGSNDEETFAVLVETIDGSALAWTPPLARCLERGRPYAWSVRALVEDETSEWATPALFEVASLPTVEELTSALKIVRRYLEAVGGAREPAPEGTPSATAPTRALLGPVQPSVAPAAGDAQLTVDGEVRTLDQAGNPQVWGRGRGFTGVWGRFISPTISLPCVDGDINYGLSKVDVDWGSAADACPEGTWVCRNFEIRASGETCNTERPDDMEDGLACDGSPLNFLIDEHLGWVETASGPLGIALAETSIANSGRKTCETLPVWCCWKAEP